VSTPRSHSGTCVIRSIIQRKSAYSSWPKAASAPRAAASRKPGGARPEVPKGSELIVRAGSRLSSRSGKITFLCP
jgi:hypothetical protein